MRVEFHLTPSMKAVRADLPAELTEDEAMDAIGGLMEAVRQVRGQSQNQPIARPRLVLPT